MTNRLVVNLSKSMDRQNNTNNQSILFASPVFASGPVLGNIGASLREDTDKDSTDNCKFTEEDIESERLSSSVDIGTGMWNVSSYNQTPEFLISSDTFESFCTGPE